jgi:hypothetical protein
VRIGVVLALLLVVVGVALAVLQPGDLGGDAASGESPPATDAPKDPPVAGSDTTVAAAPEPTTTVTPAPAPSSTGSATTAPPTTARPAPTAPGAAPTPTTDGGTSPTATPGDPSAGDAGTEAALALTGGGSLLVPGVLLAGVAAALHRTRRTV